MGVPSVRAHSIGLRFFTGFLLLPDPGGWGGASREAAALPAKEQSKELPEVAEAVVEAVQAGAAEAAAPAPSPAKVRGNSAAALMPRL